MNRPAPGANVVAVLAVAITVAVAVAVVGGCDVRGNLAQGAVFAGLRPELVDQCCTCLALRGTGDASASCTEAVLIDGIPTIPDNAVRGSGDRIFDSNDAVDDGEIPCLCQGNRGSCIEALTNQGDIIVPGACVDQVDLVAPCEAACASVLSFDPVQPP
jgi:hypothetical protein